MNTTRISRHVNAPRARVYRALLDARAIAEWKVPAGMTSHVHAFDAREGGAFRVSLTYAEPTGAGKTTAHTDTYHGRFVKLVTNEQVVEAIEFETPDPALRGEMTITVTLADADGGTDIVAVHDGLPPGVPEADNEAGWQEALAKLAALVEAGWMARDTLFLLKPGFRDPAYPGKEFYCWHCALMEGVLASFPELAARIDVLRIAWPRPRQPVVELLGEQHQSLPVLVLAEGASSPHQTGSHAGRAFVADRERILFALSERHGFPEPHP